LDFNNVTVEHPVDRIAPYIEAALINTGAEGTYINDFKELMWCSLSEDKTTIERFITPECVPDDDILQVVKFSYMYVTLPRNPNGLWFQGTFVEFTYNFYRMAYVEYTHGLHENMYMMAYSTMFFTCNANTDIYIAHNEYYNSSGLKGILYSHGSNTITVEHELYADSLDFGFATYAISQTNEITLRNITHRNTNATGSPADYYIYTSINDGGDITVEDLVFEDLNTGFQNSFFNDGFVNYLTMLNFTYRNVIVGTGSSLMDTGSFSVLQMEDFEFDTITNQTPDDEDNLMIRVGDINLDSAENSFITNIHVTNSEIDLILLSSVSGVTSESISLIFTNINYENSTIDGIRDLIIFRGIQSLQDFTFIIQDCIFSNVAFANKGSIFSFTHQLANSLILKNTVFQNITSGMIFIESDNKQNPVTTKVTMQNMTFSSIETNYISLISVFEGSELTIEDSSFSNVV
jgi:hypothetical protein